MTTDPSPTPTVILDTPDGQHGGPVYTISRRFLLGTALAMCAHRAAAATTQSPQNPNQPGLGKMTIDATPTPTVILDAPKGRHGWPFGGPIEDLAARGYIMEEFLIGGVARSYRRISDDGGGIDGVWQTEVADTASYTTRIYVVRPKDPGDFNGTVLVHWQNVTMGVDLGYPGDAEIFRGYAWVCVSAQKIGVDGVPGATLGLTSWDPERYGSLHHPGDAFSFDIFAQVGRLLRDGPALGLIDPLRGVRPRTVIATGASQSASRLATYINAVLPHERLFDGFYLIVHWGMSSLKEGESAEARMTWQGGGRYRGTSKINDRGETRVLVLATECEALHNYPARQPDTDTYRFWRLPARHILTRETGMYWAR